MRPREAAALAAQSGADAGTKPGFVAIDPGVDYFGWTHHTALGIEACGLCRPGHRSNQAPPRVRLAVVEAPDRAWKGDSRDIYHVAFWAGVWARGVAPIVIPVTPQAWIGSTPKEVNQDRIIAALDERVREMLPKTKEARGHVTDSVGLALWWVEQGGSL